MLLLEDGGELSRRPRKTDKLCWPNFKSNFPAGKRCKPPLPRPAHALASRDDSIHTFGRQHSAQIPGQVSEESLARSAELGEDHLSYATQAVKKYSE